MTREQMIDEAMRRFVLASLNLEAEVAPPLREACLRAGASLDEVGRKVSAEFQRIAQEQAA